MDPLCHTLVGGALAQSGLKRRSALGTAALLIGANLPDVDAILYFGDPERALAFRRGWTHGVLALALWPVLLTGLLLLWHRMVRRRGGGAGPDLVPRQLLVLSSLAVLSHPILDTLNTYGMRWLMPFSGRWFYGDTLFIVDPWVWLALAAGIGFSWWWERRRRTPTPQPARWALAAVTGYIVTMATIGLASRRVVNQALRAEGTGARHLMASPVPVNPFRRDIVVATADSYRVGTLHWTPRPRVSWQGSYPLLPGPDDAMLRAARTDQDVDRFLSWARFPTMHIRREGAAASVTIFDLRYVRRPTPGFGSVTTRVDPAPPAPTHVGMRIR